MAKEVGLTELIRLDIQHGCTPDLPALRYGPSKIPVFLYDDMKSSVVARSTLFEIEVGKDWFTLCNFASTVDKYTPWYSLKTSDEYEAYCLEEPVDAVYTDVEDYCMSDPLPILGKVVNVSLHGLEELDYYYDNLQVFERVKIKVLPSLTSKTPIEVFAYFSRLEGISDWDEEEKKFKVSPKIDLTPFRTTTKVGGDYYEM